MHTRHVRPSLILQFGLNLRLFFFSFDVFCCCCKGTNLPMGATVFGWVEEEQATNPFDIALHLGDLSYAGFNKDIGEIETTWDAWVSQIAPLASLMPYMTTVG